MVMLFLYAGLLLLRDALFPEKLHQSLSMLFIFAGLLLLRDALLPETLCLSMRMLVPPVAIRLLNDASAGKVLQSMLLPSLLVALQQEKIVLLPKRVA
jgi:hypothetical protein